MEKERGLTKTNFGQCNFTWPLWVQRNPLNRWVEEDAQVRGRGGNLMSVESRSGTIPEESRFTIPFLWGGGIVPPLVERLLRGPQQQCQYSESFIIQCPIKRIPLYCQR